MPKLKVFHYPNCSTCRKARKWLEANGIDHELIDIVENPPSVKQLEKIRKLSGLEVRKLFNTSGQLYRQGGYKDKLAKMTDAQAVSALANAGKLIKRPLVMGTKVGLVGFKEAEWKAALG